MTKYYVVFESWFEAEHGKWEKSFESFSSIESARNWMAIYSSNEDYRNIVGPLQLIY